MKKGAKDALDIVWRYVLLVIIGIFNAPIFYFIFTPLTLFPVYFFLKFFFDTSLVSNVIFVNSSPIELIGPCIAGSAYYLLLMLNLSTREMAFGKRIKFLLFSFFSLLLINILRIFALSAIFVSGTSFFDITHKLFWYAGSTVFVVAIWFLSVKLFRVKQVPFYSDVLFLLRLRKKSKKAKRPKKH
jgi:exosortase/archaeosortase family protein